MNFAWENVLCRILNKHPRDGEKLIAEERFVFNVGFGIVANHFQLMFFETCLLFLQTIDNTILQILKSTTLFALNNLTEEA